ncbi:hypothetical protein ACFFJ4_07615 [Xanthomonas dyei]|uniref:hypothetical protein n=1 Tax=Xanthomonas dyei TaxID=743699 RepID=UPI0011B07774|nr:hypothetical protein [Xanthomonas dyei]
MGAKISSLALINFGFLINCTLPLTVFSVSEYCIEFVASKMVGSNNHIWLNSLKPSFPEVAFLVTISGLVAITLSLIPLFIAASQISLVRLAIFKDTVMISTHKEGGPYKFSGLIAPLANSAISLMVVVWAPVYGGGAYWSENPGIFFIAQTVSSPKP